MPNGGNVIEVVISAQDQASQAIQRTGASLDKIKTSAAGAAPAITQAGQASQRADQALIRMGASAQRAGAQMQVAGAKAISSTQQISALGATTRFAAVGVIGELSPALGVLTTRMASLSTVANLAGGVLSGVFVAVGIAGAISAVTLLIKAFKSATEELTTFKKAVEGPLQTASIIAIESASNKLQTRLDALNAVVDRTNIAFDALTPEAMDVGAGIQFLTGSLDKLKNALKEGQERIIEIREIGFLKLKEELAKVELAFASLEQKAELKKLGKIETLPGLEDLLQQFKSTFATIEREELASFDRRAELAQRVIVENIRQKKADEQDLTDLIRVQSEQRLLLQRNLADRLLALEESVAGKRKKIVEEAQTSIAALLAERQVGIDEPIIDPQQLALIERLREEITAADVAFEKFTREGEAQARTLASALLSVRDRFGDEGVAAAAEAAGIAIDDKFLAAMAKIDQDPVRRLNRVTKAWDENRQSIQKTADTIGNVFSDTLFDLLEGRAKSFGETLQRVLINVARDATRNLARTVSTAALGGGGGVPFASTAVGIPFLGGAGAPTSIAELERLVTSQALGIPSFGGGGGIPQIFSSLFAGGGFVGGGAATFTPAALPGGAGAEGFIPGVTGQGGIGLAGILGGGLAGAGFASLFFPQLTGFGPQIGGGLGGIGATIALAPVLGPLAPLLGGIVGGAGGGFLGSLFGGKDDSKDNARRTTLANQTARGTLPAAQAWARDHPIIGAALLDILDSLANATFTGKRSSRGAVAFSREIEALFAGGRNPSPQEVFNALNFIYARSAFVPPPGFAVGIDEIIQREDILVGARDILALDVPSFGALTTAQAAEISILVEELPALRERIEEVAVLAADLFQFGAGLLGRASGGMTATEQLRLLLQEQGEIVERRIQLAESLA